MRFKVKRILAIRKKIKSTARGVISSSRRGSVGDCGKTNAPSPLSFDSFFESSRTVPLTHCHAFPAARVLLPYQLVQTVVLVLLESVEAVLLIHS